jgi:3-keto-disaccharide hydrolase
MNGRFVRLLAALALVAGPVSAQPSADWPIHSNDRPKPAVVSPGNTALPVPAPAGATILFGGADLSKWMQVKGDTLRWVVRDDYFEVQPGSGDLRTRDSFGDAEVHIEWMAPDPPRGSGQDRGNSGLYLMSTYELQILDSWENPTYADGQAGAIYGQFPPLVNASRPPGEWQSYDVVFRGPRFDSSGSLLRPATMTVRHNGVLVQDNVTLSGPTGHYARPPYNAHAEKLPILLQDHGHRVRFRNIWLRELR